jgi:hypothetical protein
MCVIIRNGNDNTYVIKYYKQHNKHVIELEVSFILQLLSETRKKNDFLTFIVIVHNAGLCYTRPDWLLVLVLLIFHQSGG